MWSVWSERVAVYLGTGLVLVQRAGMPLWAFEPPATLPLGDVLRQVDQALDRTNTKPWRLHVHLSAALCPPVAFTVPAGLKHWNETLAIAQATAATTWELLPEQASEVVCALDTQHAGLAAALLLGTQQQIQAWAGSHGGQLEVMQPLWAVATSAKACRTIHVQSLTLHEPDALTVLDTSGLAPRVISWAGQYTSEQAHALAEEWTRAQSDTGAFGTSRQSMPINGLTVKFSGKPLTLPSQWRDGPIAWATHWGVVS